jgi:hypothetical protein
MYAAEDEKIVELIAARLRAAALDQRVHLVLTRAHPAVPAHKSRIKRVT